MIQLLLFIIFCCFVLHLSYKYKLVEYKKTTKDYFDAIAISNQNEITFTSLNFFVTNSDVGKINNQIANARLPINFGCQKLIRSMRIIRTKLK